MVLATEGTHSFLNLGPYFPPILCFEHLVLSEPSWILFASRSSLWIEAERQRDGG